jgi:uncharacterized hydrophobic protein (TIGR00271 family)
MKRQLFRWFDLRQDQAPASEIDASMRAAARAGGTNLWVLFFAMLVASVGLNVNSTAVIIGAMLISPLMGPIVGMGYGAAVADLRLIRTAGTNLLIFTALSLVTSTIYFSLSPLNEPGSELLARTSPTLWDVLIAAFGGAAGMVAITRRGFNNIVPGVAIATALMPPLCTVGFGLAQARWDMAAGAFYLFLINSVFIAAATLAVARVLRLPPVAELDTNTRNAHRWVIGLGLTAVLVPSIWFGYRLVQDEVFQGAAQGALAGLESRTDTALLGTEIDARARSIRLTVVGQAEQTRLQTELAPLLARYGISDAQVSFRRAGDVQLQAMSQRGDQRDQRLAAVAQELQQMQQRLDSLAAPTAPTAANLLKEMRVWLPQVQSLVLTDSAAGVQQARIVLPQVLSETETQRLQVWLALRLARPDTNLIQETGPGPAKP